MLCNDVPPSATDPHPCVYQGHAIGALTNFCEHIDKTTLSPYLDAILTALGECLSVPYVEAGGTKLED